MRAPPQSTRDEAAVRGALRARDAVRAKEGEGEAVREGGGRGKSCDEGDEKEGGRLKTRRAQQRRRRGTEVTSRCSTHLDRRGERRRRARKEGIPPPSPPFDEEGGVSQRSGAMSLRLRARQRCCLGELDEGGRRGREGMG